MDSITTRLGPFGFGTGSSPAAATSFEDAGARTLWLAGGDIDRLERLDALLAATREAVVVPGIIPTGVHPAEGVAALHARAARAHPGRYLTGLGAHQAPRALDALGAYLDVLDAADPPVPRAERLLAALGPRKLAVARERFAGAVTLLVTPEHTASAREALGPGRLLAVMLPVALSTEPAAARGPARELVDFLLRVPGYRANTRRLGFTDEEIEARADRLVDAVVAHGSPDDVATIAARHREAGADHVVLSVLDGDGVRGGPDAVRTLVDALPG